jgi:HIRAN domain
MTKGRTWSTELTVVGLQFRWKLDGRKTLGRAVPFRVELEREPDNKHDENAIKVNIASDFKLTKLRGKQLGYLRANIAAKLAPHLDSGYSTPDKLWVTEINAELGEATLDARFRDKPKTAAKRRKKTTT